MLDNIRGNTGRINTPNFLFFLSVGYQKIEKTVIFSILGHILASNPQNIVLASPQTAVIMPLDHNYTVFSVQMNSSCLGTGFISF